VSLRKRDASRHLFDASLLSRRAALKGGFASFIDVASKNQVTQE
jgi:hypothetical protein